MSATEQAKEIYRREFGDEPEVVVRSPGRVNLIGDHTDYNNGLSLPMAIDRDVSIALRSIPRGKTKVYSAQEDEWGSFDANAPSEHEPWIGYLEGVANELMTAGHTLVDWQGAIASTVPAASGLSSSAALELATSMAFSIVSGIEWNALEMAKASQRAEQDWVGMRCGLLDQMSSAMGRPETAMIIDFETLEVSWVGIPPGVEIAIVDSGIARGLLDSAYNERRHECERAAAALGLPYLRGIDPLVVEEPGIPLTEAERARARHVLTENLRVLAFASALEKKDLEDAGAIMFASHRSMSHDFEASTPEIDRLVSIAASTEGCHGARMTGGGFGGAIVALVDEQRTSSFLAEVTSRYGEATGIETTGFIARPAAGTTNEIPREA